MIGPFVNAAAIVCGSIIGTLSGDKMPKDMRERMPMVLGLGSMGLGIAMIIKVKLLPVVVLSLLIGAFIGELVHLEDAMRRLAGSLKGLIERVFPTPDRGISHNEYINTFISVLVLFSVSGTGVFGAMQEGMTGDPTMLIVKAFLDCFTAVIFAITLGLPVASLAIPQIIVQVVLYFAAAAVYPLTTPDMIADFSAVGGLIMFGTGFRICGLMLFPVANMIPALFIVMPISYIWSTLLG